MLSSIGLFYFPYPCEANPLQTAEQLGENDFSGWTYGSDASKMQINCVQFVAKVLEVEIKRPLTAEERNAVLISPAPADLEKAILQHDSVTKGIQRAIVELLKKGSERSADSVEVGDFIQYWMKKADGTWFGHSGIVSKVFTGPDGHKRISIYGAHLSLGKIADNDFNKSGLALDGKDRVIYLAHLDQ